MSLDPLFFVNSIFLGAGLSMDAFSVSVADGLAEPSMKRGKRLLIAGTYALFQAAMPLLGWVFVRGLSESFAAFSKAIPYIALVLLSAIGIKMIIDGIRNKGEEKRGGKLAFGTLVLQGVATSIDALSVGFTIAEYTATGAIVSAIIIAAVTFGLCVIALLIGKKIGEKIMGKATAIGGAILILIGIEIFLRGIL